MARPSPGRPWQAGAAALLVAATASSTGCDRRVDVPAPRDVLLVTIDTARADRFSYTGAPGPGTPNVDALADRGVGFLNAISPVPLTLPAHATLLTGRLPPSHTVRDNGGFRLPASETTLAELLAQAGFSTGAFLGAGVLDADYGLDQGFATYDDEMPPEDGSGFLHYPERRGEEVVRAASRWLAAQDDGPLFAWVHLFDPHVPYRAPEPEGSRHASSYDGEIAYADRVVGRLLDDWARQRGGLERTLVVVTSDHGEALGEHDEATHGVLVHDATIRVPLVVRSPGLRLAAPIDAPVHLADVMPTVLALLGLPIPRDVHGRDLTPLLRGKPVEWSAPAGYAESLYAQIHHGCTPLLALRGPRWKLVRGLEAELYDLASDPGETSDRAVGEPDRLASLLAELDDLLLELDAGVAEAVPLDEERRRALASLGYVWSRPPAGSATTPRDPREALVTMRRMADADRAFAAGDVAAAIEGYRAVIAVEPQGVDARVRLAQLYLAARRGDEAVAMLEEAVAVAPHEPLVHLKLGRTLESLGRHRRALAAFDAGLRLHPGERPLRDGRWRCLNRLGRRELLLEEVEGAIAVDPSDGMARYARAVACCGRGDMADYRAALERELAELPGDPILIRALAQLD